MFCMQVQILSLADNHLVGSVSYMPRLVVLNMSSNHLIEPRLDAVPATLQLLYLANNSFRGDVLQLGSLKVGYMDLKLLDLSFNNLSGVLPEEIPHKLSVLNFSNNALAGSLPSSWSRLQNVADIRLDHNQLTGTLPPSWSVLGDNTDNSLQLSVTNTRLHGDMPRQWVQQFCLAIVRSGNARLLFQPIKVEVAALLNEPISVGPLIYLPAQRASINVTLRMRTFSFDYDNPDSVCGIANAARNTALLWGIFAALLVATVVGICLWQRRKPRSAPQGGLCSSISIVLKYDRLCCGKQVVNCVWFLISDIGWTLYSLVTDAITIHQVFSSTQVRYAYLLLGILLLPCAVMFILIVRVSIKRCQEQVGRSILMRWVVAPLIGLLLAPTLFLGLQLVLIIHGIGVPLPTWWGSLGVDLMTFYRMESIAEAMFNALPQSVVQSKLYLMGNDPSGVLIYINTNLFLFSIFGSLFSMYKTVALVVLELHQCSCSALGYCTRLVNFEVFPI